MASISVWQQFAVGRFVAGLGVGALSANVPVYVGELAPKNIRGTLVVRLPPAPSLLSNRSLTPAVPLPLSRARTK